MKLSCRRFITVLLFYTAAVLPAFADVVYIEDTGFVLEPPVGWTVLDINESRWTFQDFTGNAFMQIKIWPGNEWDSAEGVFEGVTDEISADAEGDFFDLYGREAVFGVLDFNSAGYDYSGYGLFADGEDFDLAILSFASTEALPLLRDYVVSALDSFALSPVLMLNPGPVSSYYLQSYGAAERQPAETVFGGEAVEWFVDSHAIETSQLIIEREASILADFKPDTQEGIEAWKRYYRMIYRDNYSRLDYSAALFRELIGDLQDAPSSLLNWVQGFRYKRTGGSDLISPLSAAAFEEGDCDSRSLLYIILLNHYGIDSAIMVSAVYSHAMAAVDVPGSGARINVNGSGFLVAETTDDVGLGMIASDMADPANWVVIPLMEKEPWN